LSKPAQDKPYQQKTSLEIHKRVALVLQHQIVKFRSQEKPFMLNVKVEVRGGGD
jgi:hypothetical protein